MFYFGVPLRSRESSRDWDQVCARFRHTIRSVTRQTSPDFTVLIACHEIPDTNGTYDSRIEFIRAPFDAPSSEDYQGQMVDKGRKVHLILSRIKQLGVGHYMQVDADDLVSRRIVEFVARKPDIHGWVIRLGYEYRIGSDFVQLNPTINRHCGTTHIVRLQGSDLPEDTSDADSPDAPARYVLRRAHHTWASGFAELGRSFRTLPFVGCVYVTGYSDNHSLNRPHQPWRRRWSLRRLVLAASPKVALKNTTRDEFGF
jgi:hypothetical protein